MTEKEKRRRLPRGRARAHVAPRRRAAAVQKVTIVSRRLALGYTLHTPQEDQFLSTKEELRRPHEGAPPGRAAEQIVFGAVTNGASNDLERVTSIARAMIFEYGMGDEVSSRTLRAGNSPSPRKTKRLPRRRAGAPHRPGLCRDRPPDLQAPGRSTASPAELLEKETLNPAGARGAAGQRAARVGAASTGSRLPRRLTLYRSH